MVTPPLPVPMLEHTFRPRIFPDIQSAPPLAQREAITPHPIISHLGEEAELHLATTSFQLMGSQSSPVGSSGHILQHPKGAVGT